MVEGAGEKEMASSVNVLKDILANAVKTVRNYNFISCIKYSKLSYCRMLCSLYVVDVVLDPYVPSYTVRLSSRPSRPRVAVFRLRPRDRNA